MLQQLSMAMLRLQSLLCWYIGVMRLVCGAELHACLETTLTSAPVCLCWCCRPPFTEVLDRLVQMEAKLEAEGSI